MSACDYLYLSASYLGDVMHCTYTVLPHALFPHALFPHALCPLPSCPLPSSLSDFDSLDERDQEKNNQLGFDVAEREFGISPCMTGKEMSSVMEPDKLSMVMYLSQFYEMFKDTVPPGGESG